MSKQKKCIYDVKGQQKVFMTIANDICTSKSSRNTSTSNYRIDYREAWNLVIYIYFSIIFRTYIRFQPPSEAITQIGH